MSPLPPDAHLRHIVSGPLFADRIRCWIELTQMEHDRFYQSAADVLRIIGIANPSSWQLRQCTAVLRQLLGPPARINGERVWAVAFSAAAQRFNAAGQTAFT
jgi:hypothetical protein